MPDLPLLDRKGNPLGELDTLLTVRAIMWSPKDKGSALSFRGLVTNDQSSPSELFKQTFLRLSKKETGGTIAGRVFISLLQFKIHRRKEASIGKAVFLVSRALEKQPLDNGRAAPVDRDYVHKFWAEFRPAAHLWGAALWLAKMGISAETDEEIGAYTYKVIYTADALLTAACAANLEFDPDPWRLPNGYPRPSLNISLPPPSGEDVELLKEYRAPVRPKF